MIMPWKSIEIDIVYVVYSANKDIFFSKSILVNLLCKTEKCRIKNQIVIFKYFTNVLLIKLDSSC